MEENLHFEDQALNEYLARDITFPNYRSLTIWKKGARQWFPFFPVWDMWIQSNKQCVIFYSFLQTQAREMVSSWGL